MEVICRTVLLACLTLGVSACSRPARRPTIPPTLERIEHFQQQWRDQGQDVLVGADGCEINALGMEHLQQIVSQLDAEFTPLWPHGGKLWISINAKNGFDFGVPLALHSLVLKNLEIANAVIDHDELIWLGKLDPVRLSLVNCNLISGRKWPDSLQRLRLVDCNATPEAISAVSQVAGIQRLQVASPGRIHLKTVAQWHVTDFSLCTQSLHPDDVAVLANMPQLTSLEIQCEAMPTEAQEILNGLWSNSTIQEVRLDVGELADTLLHDLWQNPQLRKLALRRGAANDITLERTSHCTALESLELHGDYFTEDGFLQMSSMPSLTSLQLPTFQPSTALLPQLHDRFPHLQQLTVPSVTSATQQFTQTTGIEVLAPNQP